MGKAEELKRLVSDIRKMGEKAEEISANLKVMLDKVGNPDGKDEKIIQRLLKLRDELTSVLKPLGQMREMAVEWRINLEQKNPPPR